MSKIKEFMQNKKIKILLSAIILIVVVVIIVAYNLGGSTPLQFGKVPVEIIHSNYVDWSIPEECMDYLKYEQEVNGSVVSDMFSIKLDEKEVPVFRFDFGDENAGDWLGQLTVNEETIPVVYTVFMYSDEELMALGDTEGVYYLFVDLFNQLSKDLSKNKSFTEEKPVMVSGSQQEIALTYWTFTLPVEMSCDETNENGTYKVMFYGTIRDEKVSLYQVNIGEDTVETELGTYQIDGENKVVSVVCHDIFNRSDWGDDDYAVAYLMVDTINSVIEKITSSELFSEFSEE